MKNFDVETYLGGNQSSPTTFQRWETLKCKKCKVKPKTIKREKKFNSTETGRGTLDTEWERITIKCLKCGVTEEYDGDSTESDGSYYSNEERRVYGP